MQNSPTSIGRPVWAIARRVLPWVVLVAGALRVASYVPTKMPPDLAVYRMGGRAVVESLDLYDLTENLLQMPFTYPPFAAVLFVPLHLLSGAGARVVWFALSLVLIGLCTWLLAQAFPKVAGIAPERMWFSKLELWILLTGFTLLLDPTHWNLGLGQINLLLLWLVLFDGLRMQRHGGYLTGIATGIKLVPAIFIVSMAVNREWRRALSAVAAFAATVVVGFLVMPGQSWAFWTDLAFDASRPGDIFRIDNQSMAGMLQRLGVEGPGNIVWFACIAVVFVVCMWAAMRLWTVSRLSSLSTVAIGALLISPISWNHHWIWFLPAVVSLTGLAIRAGRAGLRVPAAGLWATVAVSAIVILHGPNMLFAGSGPNPLILESPSASLVEVLGVNSFVLVGICALAALAWCAWRAAVLFGKPQQDDSSAENVEPLAMGAS